MNWEAWGPTLTTLVTVIFGAGMIYGRVKNQEVLLKEHNDTLEEHGGRITSLEGQAQISKAWREGYKAGSHKAGD